MRILIEPKGTKTFNIIMIIIARGHDDWMSVSSEFAFHVVGVGVDLAEWCHLVPRSLVIKFRVGNRNRLSSGPSTPPLLRCTNGALGSRGPSPDLDFLFST